MRDQTKDALLCVFLPIVAVLGLTGTIIYNAVLEQRADQAKRIALRAALVAPIPDSQVLANLQMCHECHGPALKGMHHNNIFVPDISSTSVSATWSAEAFITAMRTGQQPDGRHFSEAMPWRKIGDASDEHLLQLRRLLQDMGSER